MKRKVTKEEIELLENSDESKECGHAHVLHIYNGGDEKCAVPYCGCTY